jgi:hypothetical protein
MVQRTAVIRFPPLAGSLMPAPCTGWENVIAEIYFLQVFLQK